MKIRIRGNSMRIRLSRTEVDNFGKDGYVEEQTNFGTSVFTYALERKAGINALAADFANGKMTMLVPEAMAIEWTTTETVGYNNNMDLGNGEQLFLLLEKDFKCIDSSVMEDQSDNYENPLHTC